MLRDKGYIFKLGEKGKRKMKMEKAKVEIKKVVF